MPTGRIVKHGKLKVWTGDLPVMTKRQMRRLALKDPAAFKKYISGARERELAARHLILTPSDLTKASIADLQALAEYIKARGWSSLYGHDRRMWRLLRDGAMRFLRADIPDIPLSETMRVVRTMGFKLSIARNKN